MGSAQSPQPAWMRGVLPLCLLSVLDSEDRSYGYALLGRLSDAGLENIKAATLYPALTRLEEEGAVEVEWGAGDGGPGRKYYRITERGRARLHGDEAAWRAFAATVESVLADRVPRERMEQGEPGEQA
ncbi:PadR family transcriptional regulator [Streptomyces sp. HNM0663]|uniref:PadR family transcriptional regulator n=1 Tax=Streptomyces chengmaiensis TaxID=3040919 RepID=A0ABT6HFM6_9ACTN|nr:PadR family transcriptional regulator [Streptomyces chengmaiensis]MDH2387569.1 PadR family transcriptional regulator [Streptomyces chengmaiensis]